MKDQTIQETIVNKGLTMVYIDPTSSFDASEVLQCKPVDPDHCESFLGGKGCKYINDCRKYQEAKHEN